MTSAFESVQETVLEQLRPSARALLLSMAVMSAACGGGAPAPGAQAAAAPPPMPVEIVTLAPKPVEDLGEFIGAVKSLQSTTVQPQAEGLVTKIQVKSGDRVKPGDVLMEIDAASQQAAVASLESTRIAREADASWA